MSDIVRGHTRGAVSGAGRLVGALSALLLAGCVAFADLDGVSLREEQDVAGGADSADDPAQDAAEDSADDVESDLGFSDAAPDIPDDDAVAEDAPDAADASDVAVGDTPPDAPVNHPPVAMAESYQVFRGEALIVEAAEGVLVNDGDLDDDPLSAELVRLPQNGTFALEQDGSFSYIAGMFFVGNDSFTYRASDGEARSADTIVTISVVIRGAVPVAMPDQYRVSQGRTLNIQPPGVLMNDHDADTPRMDLMAFKQAGPNHGTVDLRPDGSFVYSPEGGYVGQDVFTYYVSDGENTSPLATVTITIE